MIAAAAGPVALSVSVNGLVPSVVATHAELPAFVAELEAVGVDQVVLGEHLLQTAEQHPGAVGVDLMMPFPEPLVLLAAVAAATSRIELTTGAVIAALRPAVLLAKLAATVDVLSGGRFTLGLTSGWSAPELAAVGVPFEERFARLDEAVAVCRALWGPPPATYHGRWARFDDAWCEPAPVRGAATPIWFGGLVGERSARRAAACDGWIVSEATPPEDIPEGIARIEAAARAAGGAERARGVRATLSRRLLAGRRDLSVPEVAALVHRGIDELAARGATAVVVPLGAYVEDRDRAPALAAAVAGPVPSTSTSPTEGPAAR